MRQRAGAATALIGVALALVLAACSSGGSGSRATLYDGLDALAADSTAVVVATVTEVRPGSDDTVVAAAEVDNAPTAPRLADNLDGGDDVAVGDTVRIRQTAEGYRLEPGSQYLLYLTATRLAGDDADTFFVTGVEAGIYVRDGDRFVRAVPGSGDTLPETIDIAG